MGDHYHCTMEMYLVRHGQTDFNARGIIQGRSVDSDLNAVGRAQAADFYQSYGHLHMDRIYTSSQRRSIQSVEAWINQDTPHEILPELDEISWGTSEGIPSTSDSIAEYVRVKEAWAQGHAHARLAGGESLTELATRVKRAVDLIESRREDRILVCSHGRTMRVLQCLLHRRGLEHMEDYAHSNLALIRLVYAGDGWEAI